MNKLIRNISFIAILLIISILFTSPFFHKGFFPTQDGGWAIVRLSEMVREIKDLQFPPRWSDYLNHGYGYPLFQFTYPFPYYLGSILKLIGFGYINSIKIIFIFSVFLSGVSMFMLGKKLTNNWGGLFSGIFYIIAPYRLSNLYVRGSIGEIVSLVFYPLIFLITIQVYENSSRKYPTLLSILFATLILTHNISALIFMPIWIGFIYAFGKIRKIPLHNQIIRIYPIIFWGLGISAYFFLPALLEKRYIVLSKIKLSDVTQNFLPVQSYFIENEKVRMPFFLIGNIQLIASIISVILCFLSKLNLKRILGIYFLLGISFCLLLTNKNSGIIWNYAPLSWIDFPWRFNNVLIFTLSLSTIYLSEKVIIRWMSILFIAFALIINFKYTSVSTYDDMTDNYYLTNDATTTSADELMPIWVTEKPRNRYIQKVQIENGIATISDVVYKSNEIRFLVYAKQRSRIQVNSIYFPGWLFSSNGKKMNIDISSPNSTISFEVQKGMNYIIGKFTETPLRAICDFLTILSIMYVPIYLLVGDKNKRNPYEKINN